MNPRGFHTITLGCKLNQFDSAAIAEALTEIALWCEAHDVPISVAVARPRGSRCRPRRAPSRATPSQAALAPLTDP